MKSALIVGWPMTLYEFGEVWMILLMIGKEKTVKRDNMPKDSDLRIVSFAPPFECVDWLHFQLYNGKYNRYFCVLLINIFQWVRFIYERLPLPFLDTIPNLYWITVCMSSRLANELVPLGTLHG